MKRVWLGSADVTVNAATGALLVELSGGGGEGATPVANADVSVVEATTGVVTLLEANASRRGAVIHNGGSGALFVKLGADASTSSYSYRLSPGAHLELPAAVYTGLITGVWDETGGSAAITELS